MRNAVKGLVIEAFRRWQSFHAGKEPTGVWLGLGFISEYRPGVDAGLFTSYGAHEPRKRVMHWWLGTPKLAALLHNMKAAGVTLDNAETYLESFDWNKLSNIYG